MWTLYHQKPNEVNGVDIVPTKDAAYLQTANHASNDHLLLILKVFTGTSKRTAS